MDEVNACFNVCDQRKRNWTHSLPSVILSSSVYVETVYCLFYLL